MDEAIKSGDTGFINGEHGRILIREAWQAGHKVHMVSFHHSQPEHDMPWVHLATTRSKSNVQLYIIAEGFVRDAHGITIESEGE